MLLILLEQARWVRSIPTLVGGRDVSRCMTNVGEAGNRNGAVYLLENASSGRCDGRRCFRVDVGLQVFPTMMVTMVSTAADESVCDMR
jgi:hypothetical protein